MKNKILKYSISNKVWLYDLPEQSKKKLRKDLTLKQKILNDYANPIKVKLYIEKKDGSFGIPINYWLDVLKPQVKFDLKLINKNLTETKFITNFESKVKFKEGYEYQREAVNSIVEQLKTQTYGGILLQAPPGTGKTVMALQIAYELGLKTLILVHKDFFINQWGKRINTFFPKAKIGVIKQNTASFENADFTIGLVQSLTKDRISKYNKNIHTNFGLIISDEVHRLSAPTWSFVISEFNPLYKLGITATPRRKDGMENIFFWEIGQIKYVVQSESMKIDLKKIEIDLPIPSNSFYNPKKRLYENIHPDRMNALQLGKTLSKINKRNKIIAKEIFKYLIQGRKIMVISSYLEHLNSIMKHLDAEILNNKEIIDNLSFDIVIDTYTGEWFTGQEKKKGRKKIKLKKRKTQAQLEKAEEANIIFSTRQMVEEGLDIAPLDCLFLTLPISDIEQAVGRVRRFCKPNDYKKCKHYCSWRKGSCNGKKTPIVIEFVDTNSQKSIRVWESKQEYYSNIKNI